MPRYRIEWFPEAEAELQSAENYLRGQRPTAADDFIQRMREAIADLEESAHTYTSPDPEVRWYLLEQFPYAVIYQLFDDEVVIIAVMHLKRRPGHWKTRL